MTPRISEADLIQRRILDPNLSDHHVLDILNRAKDGSGAQDHMSDHVIGMFIWSKEIGVIKAWEQQVFQAAFVKGGIRKSYQHFGGPFLGPDGKPLRLENRALVGDGRHGHEVSDLTIEALQAHPNYNQWLRKVLYAGLEKSDTSYERTEKFNTIKECDRNVNGKAYNAGPGARELTDDEERLIAGKKSANASSGEAVAEVSPTKKLIVFFSIIICIVSGAIVAVAAGATTETNNRDL